MLLAHHRVRLIRVSIHGFAQLLLQARNIEESVGRVGGEPAGARRPPHWSSRRALAAQAEICAKDQAIRLTRFFRDFII
jgi:hypothetical protein